MRDARSRRWFGVWRRRGHWVRGEGGGVELRHGWLEK